MKNLHHVSRTSTISYRDESSHTDLHHLALQADTTEVIRTQECKQVRQPFNGPIRRSQSNINIATHTHQSHAYTLANQLQIKRLGDAPIQGLCATSINRAFFPTRNSPHNAPLKISYNFSIGSNKPERSSVVGVTLRYGKHLNQKEERPT